MSGNDPLLSGRDLAFAYGRGRVPVLADLAITVDAGSHVGIVGPNGAGKSTLLKVLAGILRPTTGEVVFAGQDLRQWRRLAIARKVAYVPQTAPPDLAFTALEVALAGRFAHVGYLGAEGPRDVAIAREALTRVGAGDLADRPFAELSGGEQARVIVARALAQEPVLLLLDEPTAFLDIGSRVELHDRLREENRARGLTIVTVTHDLNLAAEYCHRIALLSEGRLTAFGPPSEVLTPERIEKIYRCRVAVDANPATGAPRVTPLPRHAP